MEIPIRDALDILLQYHAEQIRVVIEAEDDSSWVLKYRAAAARDILGRFLDYLQPGKNDDDSDREAIIDKAYDYINNQYGKVMFTDSHWRPKKGGADGQG